MCPCADTIQKTWYQFDIRHSAVGINTFTHCDEIAEPLKTTGPAITDETETINLSGSVLFDFDSDKLTPAAEKIIEDYAYAFSDECIRIIQIFGHTDGSGSEAHNLDLSLRRAEAVKRSLVKNGVKESLIECMGFGSTLPVAENTTEEGRANNRRIEIKITKKAC